MEKKIQPTDAELEILTILWQHGPATVRMINEQMNNTRKVGYTTSLKLLQIMHEKGFVAREGYGKSHIYSALAEENDVQNRLIDKLLDAAFGGSASKLVMQALGNHKASTREREAIRRLLDQLDNTQNNQ